MTSAATIGVMNQYTKFANEIGMAVFDFEVKDFDGFGQFQKVDAADGCSIPVLGIDNVTGNQIAGIHPTLALYLEGVGLGALNDLTVDVQLIKAVSCEIIMSHSRTTVN